MKVRCGVQIEQEIIQLTIKRGIMKQEVLVAKAALNVIDQMIAHRREEIKSIHRIVGVNTRV